MTVCANCGAEITPEMKFCSECGTRLDHGQSTASYAPAFEEAEGLPPPKSKGLLSSSWTRSKARLAGGCTT